MMQSAHIFANFFIRLFLQTEISINNKIIRIGSLHNLNKFLIRSIHIIIP